MEVLWKYYSVPWTVLWVPYGQYYSVLQGTMESVTSLVLAEL